MRSLSLFILFTLFPFVTLAQDNTVLPEGVMYAAHNGLSKFINSIPEGYKEPYGFSNEEDLSKVVLLNPIPAKIIDFDLVKNFHQEQNINELISKPESWYVPVSLEGKIRSILIVENNLGTWQAVSFGQAPLANEINSITGAWPQSSGYTIQLFISLEGRRHFFHIPQIDGKNLTLIEMSSAPHVNSTTSKQTTSFNTSYGNITKAHEALNVLKSIEIGG